MPTNFPTSVDNFTNPTANDSLNLPSHSTQHANANDAIEAIEGYLLNGGQGLTLIKNQAITSGVSIVTLSNVFSATYDNYKVIFSNITSSTAAATAIQLNTVNTNYYSTVITAAAYSTASGTLTYVNSSNFSSYDAGVIPSSGTTQAAGGTMEIQNPFSATSTSFQHSASDARTGGFGLRTGTGYHSLATSYTDLRYLIGSGTFTGGNVAVYGYAKG